MRPIKQCINKQLADICRHSLQLEELSNKVQQLLPAEFAAHCHVGSFNKGCLLLTTTNAAWASQLRYAIPELRDRLRKEAQMYQLLSIKIAVVAPPAQQIVTKSPAKVNSLSDKAKNTIISESQQCNYQPLKKALLDLSR